MHFSIDQKVVCKKNELKKIRNSVMNLGLTKKSKNSEL